MLRRIKQFLKDLANYLYLFFYVLFYVILLFPLWHLLSEMRKAKRNERGIQEDQEGH